MKQNNDSIRIQWLENQVMVLQKNLLAAFNLLDALNQGDEFLIHNRMTIAQCIREIKQITPYKPSKNYDTNR